MWVCRHSLKVCFHINMENPASFYTLILTSLQSVWWFHAEKSTWTCQRRHLCLFSNSNRIRKKTYTNQSLLCWTGFPHFLQRVWVTNCLAQWQHSEFFADGYYILICTFAKLRRQDRSSTELKGDFKHLVIQGVCSLYYMWLQVLLRSKNPVILVAYFSFFSEVSISFAQCCIRRPLRRETFTLMDTEANIMHKMFFKTRQ